MNLDTLNNMATEFLEIYEKAPPKLKKKLLNHLKGKDSVRLWEYRIFTSVAVYTSSVANIIKLSLKT